jgi:hypothetical protein
VIQVKDWITLVSQFKSHTLPKTEWTHEAHLVIALWHLFEYKNTHSTLCHLRAGIILHNHSVGIQNTESRGYHETITVFWLKQIKEFVESEGSEDFTVLVERLLKKIPFTRKDYILQFYTRETLKSSEARCFYVAPF